ncbi:MAG: hypothetical protein ACOVNY_06295 [Chitinophagaceae bacterium]
MKKNIVSILAILFTSLSNAQNNIQFIQSFPNTNHPQIAYWFFNKDMLNEIAWKNKIDSLATYSKYTLIFLTARNNVDFYDTEKMKPIFSELVNYAHKKGIQIGLQLWNSNENTSELACERVVIENEITLDNEGYASIYNKAKHVRAQSGKPFKSALLKAYLFKKTATGFYEPNSLKDITPKCITTVLTDSSINLQIQTNKEFAGYSVYILSQHFYKVSSNHSQEAIDKIVNNMLAYKNIPFDGIGLDEYTNLKLFATWELQRVKEPLRERLYSLDMAKKYKELYQYDIEKTLFDMRYAPANKPEVRIKAINTYMDLMRKGTLNVETAVYNYAKKIFGANTFVGLHDSHHNHLEGDEIWQTGINWWNVKRDYGHTDEGTPTPTQLGILYGYSNNMLYNMYYDKKIDKIEEKAYTDLLYNIRTHYHAINDVQNWGVSVEQPYALEKINPVENCARLLNQFNPSKPAVKLLIVFGREALMNWYPDTTQRGICDINDKLKIEEKAVQVWKAGYLNVVVPTDVIDDGRLFINSQGKAVYNGNIFDAIIFLYPEYAKEKTLQFLEKYTDKNGKLMIEGKVTKDYFANDISQRWQKIANKASFTKFDINNITHLGISKNNMTNSIQTNDNSWIFNDHKRFTSKTITLFEKTIEGNIYTGKYCGYAALKCSNNNISKFAATDFQELSINGKIVFSLSKPADVFIVKNIKGYDISIASNEAKILVNDLK